MPHTGKPSGACQNCKQRHIKCDEARPACVRCVKANVDCPGYSEGLDLVLRDQNDIAKTKVERRQRALNKKKAQSPPGSRSSECSTFVATPTSLAEPVENRELCFFVSSYVLYPRDPQADRGFLELLPLLFANIRPNSPLSYALAAVSRCQFVAWELGVRDVETPRVRFAYGKALAATRLALQDPVECSTDETLMAVCLLGFYEAVADSFRARISPVQHFEGAASLIKQRNGNSTSSELFTKLLIGVRSNIVSRAIVTQTSVDINSELWKDVSGSMPCNPATVLDCMCADVANLLAAANQILANIIDCTEYETDTETREPELVLQAETVDAQLAMWPDMLSINWTPIRIFTNTIPQEVIDAGVYGNSCDVYSDIDICSTWNDWRHVRLKVLALVARLGDSDSRARAVTSIQQLADDICASVPFCLGSRVKPTAMYAGDTTYPCAEGQAVSQAHQQRAAAVGGWSLFLPLKETLHAAKNLRRGQREWVLEQLRRLATVYNIRPIVDKLHMSARP